MSRLVCAALAIGFVPIASGQSSLLIETDTYRFGGTYLAVPADSAERCAQLCGLDEQCTAWSWSSSAAQQTSCEFKSRLGRSESRPGWASGTSLSAPALHAIEPPQPAPSTTPRATAGTHGLRPVFEAFNRPYTRVSEGIEVAELLGGFGGSATTPQTAPRPRPRPALNVAVAEPDYRPQRVFNWTLGTPVGAQPEPQDQASSTRPSGPSRPYRAPSSGGSNTNGGEHGFEEATD